MAKEKASIRVPVGDKVFRVISYVICIAFALAACTRSFSSWPFRSRRSITSACTATG